MRGGDEAPAPSVEVGERMRGVRGGEAETATISGDGDKDIAWVEEVTGTLGVVRRGKGKGKVTSTWR